MTLKALETAHLPLQQNTFQRNSTTTKKKKKTLSQKTMHKKKRSLFLLQEKKMSRNDNKFSINDSFMIQEVINYNI